MNRFILIAAGLLFSGLTLAGTNGMVFVPKSVPAVSEAGLIGAAIALGILGAKFIKKIKK